MSVKSAIEWTDATWNPTTGCTKVSPACANCYIERTPPFRVRNRVFVNGHIPLEFHPERLEQPLRRKKPTTYFVNSLSDLFHPDVPDDFLHRVYATMEAAHWHTFQILTKRAERMRDYLAWRYGPREDDGGSRIPSRHIWHGVSAENQAMADKRLPVLGQTRSAVRFVSIEPMLSEMSLRWLPMWDGKSTKPRSEAEPVTTDHLDGLRLLHWIIVGGESGPHVRPTDPAWIRKLRDECVGAGVPFFFKQWGGKTAKAGGRELDGRTWDQMPELHRREREDPVARIR